VGKHQTTAGKLQQTPNVTAVDIADELDRRAQLHRLEADWLDQAAMVIRGVLKISNARDVA
jgi:hypothetical protein